MRAGTPPALSTISLTGRPLISTSLPPMWNEPIVLSVIGASSAEAVIGAAVSAAARPIAPAKAAGSLE